MGAELDRLEIQVEAQATRANSQLDKLVTKLDRVSGALSNLNSSGLTGLSNGVTKFAQASAQLSNVKTADFTRLIKNIDKLANLNTQQIYGAASSMRTLSSAINSLSGVSTGSLQVAEVAKSIGKLGGANVQKAIANLPALAIAMNNFMATMAKAPQVSDNIIQMTNALASLASQGAKVGTAGNSLTTSTNRIGISMEKTTKKARSFSSVIGSIYQKYFLVMRAGNKLWDSIKSSMDYAEVLNYFDAAFGQVADSAVGQWEEAGADSAEDYFTSFSDRAKQLTTKMTGFTITDSGMLESTGSKSLGINPNTLMNYQAMFAQMSNSMGVTAETSLKLSTALTEIGADLASVKNMDFDRVWKDMASGLAGMSRTLDKYGVNIRNVNLQQRLNELGIEANISALNQNDKALLRTIILLDSTRYAWGDLADTINQPANQLRLLQSNFGNLARTIGNIFLPIVAEVLPYVNALVIALQKLAEFVVKLIGFEDFDWGGSSGIGGGDLSDILGTDEATDGLNGATAAAQKLKDTVLGIDELNINSPKDDSNGSGSGSGGIGTSGLLDAALDKILEEYQITWNKAFDNMEARYDSFAEHVAEAFKSGGMQGVGEYFTTELTNALNNIPWDAIYEGARTFGTGFADFLNGLISPELFGAVGSTIASALNTAIYTALSFGETFDFEELGVSIATWINEFFETCDFGALAETLNAWVDGLEETIGEALQTIEWETILSEIGDFLGNLEPDTILFFIGIASSLKGFGKNLARAVLTGAIKGIMEATGVESIWGIIKSVVASISTNGLPAGMLPGTPMFDVIGSWFLGGIEDAMERLLPDWINDIIGKLVAGFSAGGVAGSWIPGIGSSIGGIIGVIVATVPDIIREKLFNFDLAFEWFDKAKEAFKTAFDGKRADFMDIGGWILEGILDGLTGALVFILEPFGDLFAWVWEGICLVFDMHSPSKKMKPLGEFILLGIVEGFTDKVSEFTKAISDWFNESVKPWFTKEKWTELYDTVKTALQNKWDEVVNWWNNSAIARWWNDNVAPWFSKEKWSFGGIKTGFSEAWNSAVESIRGIWNSFADWLNERLTIKIDTSSLIGKGIQQMLGADTIKLGNIPKFQIGGFPEDGLFFANHHELIGQFSNGKTAVANNEQIVEGIQFGVREANAEQNALLREQNELLRQLLEKDVSVNLGDREIARASLRGQRQMGVTLRTT